MSTGMGASPASPGSCKKTNQNSRNICSRHITSVFHFDADQCLEIFQTLEPWDKGRNAGVGLAIVHKAVVGQGGKVWVESDGSANRGATFCFTWPKVV